MIVLFSDADLFSITAEQAVTVTLSVIGAYILCSLTVLILRRFASDRAYGISKKAFDLFWMLSISPFIILLAGAPIFSVMMYAREWCLEHGKAPLEMAMLLIPIVFLFFVKPKFRIPSRFGNAVLVTALFVYARLSIGIILEYGYTTVDTEPLMMALCAFLYVLVWLFEQTLRDGEGKLSVLSRILLTVTALVCTLYLVTVVIGIAHSISQNGFLWEYINSLLIAIPTCVLFVAYIVKANKLNVREV